MFEHVWALTSFDIMRYRIDGAVHHLTFSFSSGERVEVALNGRFA